MIDILFFLIYRHLLIPLVLFFLKALRPLLSPKIKKMMEERETPQRPVIWAKPIWIHASSGEIEYAKPVIRELKSRYPEIPILVTYFSPSALKLIQGIPEIDFVLPLPFDHRKKVKAFIDYANPTAVLFARTDVWPELALQLNQKKIPTLLFAATLSTDSGRAQGLGKFLARFAFDQLSEISCVNEEDQRVFTELGVSTNVRVQGDTRYDQVAYRLENPKNLKEELRPPPGRVLVVGSSWPQDEAVIFGGFADWLSQNGQIILAPHETNENHLQQIEAKLKALGLNCQRYSTATHFQNSVILLVDQVGILPELYAWGSIAFVGGSFKDRVHSVMEPLAAGLPVIVGPHILNNREALHFNLQFLQDKNTVVTVAKGVEDFKNQLEVLGSITTTVDKNGKSISQIIKKMMAAKTGVSSAIASWPLMSDALNTARPGRPISTDN